MLEIPWWVFWFFQTTYFAAPGEDGEEGDEDDDEDEEGDEVEAASGGIGQSKGASGTQDILGKATVAAQVSLPFE